MNGLLVLLLIGIRRWSRRKFKEFNGLSSLSEHEYLEWNEYGDR